MSGDISFKDAAACDDALDAMARLKKEKGWLFFVASMEKAQNFIIESLPNLPTEFDRSKALGELVQLRKAIAFPDKMIQQAHAARERLKKKEQ